MFFFWQGRPGMAGRKGDKGDSVGRPVRLCLDRDGALYSTIHRACVFNVHNTVNFVCMSPSLSFSGTSRSTGSSWTSRKNCRTEWSKYKFEDFW